MKLKAQLGNAELSISLERSGTSVTAIVDDRHYEVEITRLGTGEYLLKLGTEIFRCRVEHLPSSTNSFAVNVRGHDHEVTLIDPKRLRSAQSAAAHDHGEVRIVSAMPGKVVRVLVEQGATVAAGDGIIVVEAMKMQNEMKTPKAGTVAAINAELGATVNAGEVLAVIE
ncbi:MAG TPA: biotin/lipoyl-containing protein [Pyrinomonadaceae bacterium]|nr:biotin/lipoyl-containing protein [Pyrinomonadaceae bacterium]